MRQLPVRSVYGTSRLLNNPTSYSTHQSLPPTPPATLSLPQSPTSTSGGTLRFSWDLLLAQMCSFLQRASAEVLNVNECGAIGLFVSDEIRLHAIELSNEHILGFQKHMDDLLQCLQKEITSAAAAERIVRFVRGQPPQSTITLRVSLR